MDGQRPQPAESAPRHRDEHPGHPEAGFVLFLAAATRTSFDRLLDAAEQLSYQQGKTSLFTRTSSSSWRTWDALTRRGYQAYRLMMRMKAGQNPDYDHTSSYCLDSWL
jgi:hypothetical protein